jgi:hypothetical protein
MISLLLQLAVVIVFQVSSLPAAAGGTSSVGRLSDDTGYMLCVAMSWHSAAVD